MSIKYFSTSLTFLLCASLSFSQVETDKKIQLTGSGADAKIEGVEEVLNNHDAANKIYVDTTVANALGGATPPSGVTEIQVNGALWVKNTDESGTFTWTNAINACNSLSYSGFDDWYLPTYSELWGMLEKWTAKCGAGNCPLTGFSNANYWSSTEHDGPSAKKGVNFSGQYSLPSDNPESTYRIRCVRRP